MVKKTGNPWSKFVQDEPTQKPKLLHQTRGVASPYKDDPYRYLWDWDQDCFATDDSDTPAPQVEIDPDAARELIAKNALVPSEDGDIVDVIEEASVWYTADGTQRVIGLVVYDEEGAMQLYHHPKWVDVDWEDFAYKPAYVRGLV